MSARRRTRRRREATPAERRDAGLRTLGLDPGPREPLEWWAWPCFGALALLIAAFGVLGARPGGPLPIWIWLHGRFHLALLALVLLGAAVALSASRRPFLQRRRGRALVSLVLVIGLAPFPMPYPAPREGRPSSVPFRLPVDGPWLVAHGGDGREENLLGALSHDRRWGLVLVLPDDREPGDPRAHPAWGRPVLAAADGRVAWARDGVPDGDGSRDGGPPHGDLPYGNLVVIEVAEGEYLFTCHLRNGSVRVGAGDEVAAGDVLGEVGTSGGARIAREPCVAVHLQDTPDEIWGAAVPWRFRDYEADGRRIDAGEPRGGARGQRVRHLGPPAR